MFNYLNQNLKLLIPLGGTFLIGGLIVYVMTKKKKIYVPTSQVDKLIIYPVKSLPGIEIDSCEVTKYGIKYNKIRDRLWILVNEERRFITQRQENSLALLKTRIISDDQIQIEDPNGNILIIQVKEQINSDDVIVNTKVWTQQIAGVDCGEEASRFFSRFLNQNDIRLLQFAPEVGFRPSTAEVNGKIKYLKKYPIGFQDGSPILLINNSSIDDLITKFSNDEKVIYKNFRPNILMSSEPYSEDNWKFIKINQVELLNIKLCTRCVLTTVNVETGVRGKEPLETLKKYRLAPEDKKHIYKTDPLFGINLAVESYGKIFVGNEISVVKV